MTWHSLQEILSVSLLTPVSRAGGPCLGQLQLEVDHPAHILFELLVLAAHGDVRLDAGDGGEIAVQLVQEA